MNRQVKSVKVGDLTLDGKKIYIQSMLNVPACDIERSVEQAVLLEKAGCEIIRRRFRIRRCQAYFCNKK